MSAEEPPARESSSNVASASTASSQSVSRDDELLALKMQTMDQLQNAYGFSESVARRALEATLQSPVDHPQDPTNVTNRCIQYIFDQGLVAEDRGGPILPRTDCPHVISSMKARSQSQDHDSSVLSNAVFTAPCNFHLEESSTRLLEDPKPRLKADINQDGRCPSTENWMCLGCGAIRCSRYVNGHSLTHYEKGKATSNEPPSCAVAVSLSDLSVWCYECQAYVISDQVKPLLKDLEQLKFGTGREAPRPFKKVKSFHEFDSSSQEYAESTASSNSAKKTPEAMSASPSNSEEEDTQEDEEDSQQNGTTIEINLDDIENEEQLLQVLERVAAARGIPLDFLLAQLNRDGQDDDEPVEYPFDRPPETISDIASFIQSDKCRKIVILAGAGMSVNSNIPDFRSPNGLYATMDATKLTASAEDKMAIHLDPAYALEKPLFLRNPLPCLELMRSFITGVQSRQYKATLAHRFVELLHKKTGKLARLYTQNIDGLEDQCTDFPKENRIAVHGSLDQAECAHCGHHMDYESFVRRVKTQIRDITGEDCTAPSKSTPICCENCDQPVVKPGIVLFKESLPEIFFRSVQGDVEDVDLLIVIGTSLKVAPANTLVWRVPRSALRVLVNREPVGLHLGLDFERERDFFAEGDIDEVLLDLMVELGWLDDLEPLLRNDLLPEKSAELLNDRLQSKSSEDHNNNN